MAEVVTEICPVSILRVGIQDVFGRSGKPYELLEMYGLTAQNIVKQEKVAISKKQ